MADETNEEVIVWGKKLVEDKAWVLHRPTLVVGIVERFYTAVDDDKWNDVEVPVIALTSGDTFVARREMWIVLGVNEAKLYATAIEKLRTAIVETVQEAASTLQLAPPVAIRLIESAVNQHLRSLMSARDEVTRT